MNDEKQIVEELDENRVVIFEEAVEAVLFAAGHPVTYATLARVLEMTPALVKDKVFEYALKYNNPEMPRGVILLTYKDSCQLCTKENYLSEIRNALGIRKSGSLSTSSMEVLAIVAYNQPVTRAFVDTLRRVDSSYAMNNLLDRGLITSTGRLDVPGRPMLYGTTSDFLRCFGLSDLDSLPATSDELVEVFEGARANEEAELAEEMLSGGEQLTLDIEDSLPTSDENKEDIQDEKSAETGSNEDIQVDEYSPEFDEPSADDDIHED